MKNIFILLVFFFSMLNASIIKDLQLNKNDVVKIRNAKNKTYILTRLNNFKKLKEELKYEKNYIIKLNKVNNFFNKFISLSDKKNYKKIDYWASRKEFLLKGKGDCEDYVISKYFTLLELGFKTNNLSLIQAKYKNQLHLVLAYITSNEKLILDNINKNIIDIKKRKDLEFLFEMKAFKMGKKDKKSVKNLLYYKWNKLLLRID